MTDHSIEILRELVDYNPESGVLTWKPRNPSHFKDGLPRSASAWNTRYAGKQVGRLLSGYMQTMVTKERCMVHRLAWMLFHGVRIPEGAQIDHINGEKADNRIENLRLCTASQNMQNRECARAGMRGALFHKSTGKWQASLRVHLGTFDTQEEAASAYEFAAKKLHNDFYLEGGKRVTISGGAKTR